MIADLRTLWKEAFGDTEETLDKFFSTGFSPDRHHAIYQANAPVSALYWFDCRLDGRKLAYIYAVATLKAYRGQGLAQRLMTETHEILQKQGYSGAILVPGEKELFAFYEKLGYRNATKAEDFSVVAADSSVSICEISPVEYAAFRRKYLPEGGVLQEGETLSYLATYAKFYKGEDFLLSATKEEDTLLVHEILGNANACGNILQALTCKTGRFRTPCKGRDFAMYLPLSDACPCPAYFGLALD